MMVIFVRLPSMWITRLLSLCILLAPRVYRKVLCSRTRTFSLDICNICTILDNNKITILFDYYSRDSRYVAQDANQSNLGLLPFFHVYGLLVGLCDLGQNHQIVVLNRFDPILFLVAIEKYRIQRLWLAPPLLVFLAKTPLITDYDLSCVREIGSAAAPLDETVERILKNRSVFIILFQKY